MTDNVSHSTDGDVEAVMDLITGSWAAQALRAIAELGVADSLASGPATAEQVAASVGTNSRAMYRLMRAATALGLLSYEGDMRFALTDRGQLLRNDIPGSLNSMAQAMNDRGHWQSWGLFPTAVRTGEPQAKQALGTEVFPYFAQPENAREAELFSRAMGNYSSFVVDEVAVTISVPDGDVVIDVGGANGDLVLGLLRANPALRGQVFDLDHVVQGAHDRAAELGLSESFSAVGGDFFDSVPAADVYLLKHVLHDWDDVRALQILRNCRAAIAQNGRAFIIELIIGEIGTDDFATRMDMNMLALSGGMERDLSEFDQLFAESGWQRVHTHVMSGGYGLLELSPI